ncbi:MAG: hypothetical protein HYW81_00280, partial [Parcubacteria group bacterium]|nr:hypothetical protein [Parcubacteria group bacterium]
MPGRKPLYANHTKRSLSHHPLFQGDKSPFEKEKERRQKMKKLFAVLAAGALLLLGSTAAQAAVYNIYGRTGPGTPSNKVVANMQFAVTGQAVTPPEVQSQITEADSTRTITAGTYDTIAINEGDVIYVEGIVRVNTLRNTAENAVFLLSSNKPSALMVRGGSVDLRSRNGLIQILGPGREHETYGLLLWDESSGTLGNVVIADLSTGINISNGDDRGEKRENGSQLVADQLFILNNQNQLVNGIFNSGFPPVNGRGAQITLTNSVIWDSQPALYGDLEAIRLFLPMEFEAINSSFSDDVGIGSAMYLADLRSMPHQSRIVFQDCAFSDLFMQELRYTLRVPTVDPDALGVLDGEDVVPFITVRETRPILGGTHVVKTFPDVPVIAIADVTGNGTVNLEDFKILAASYGKPNDQVQFARILDLDGSGTAADDGDMIVFARAFAGLSANAADSELMASEQMPVLAGVLVHEYRPVADALMGNAVFGPAITSYLQRTAVAEVSGETP